MRDDPLIALFLLIAPLSLAAVGGASSIYAPLQYNTVDVYQWLTAQEFLEMFAIARVAPGPGSMITTLIGWKVAGLAGAVVATIALYVPASIVCFFAARAWNRYRGTQWHAAIEAGLLPVAAGLVLAAVVVLLQIAETGPFSWAVIGIASLIFVAIPKIHPLVVLVAGGAAYVLAFFAGWTTF
jgi:chromate transporter